MTESRTVVVTGGAGYIGSHTCLTLLAAGWRVVVLDNLANSSVVALDRVRALAGDAGARLSFVEGDIRVPADLDRAFVEAGDATAVIHFAGLKAVGESVAEPLRYYDNNVGGTVALLDAMVRHEVHDLVFSSSATVYGQPEHLPITEDSPLGATNPYGRTKLFIEEMLRDLSSHRRLAHRAAALLQPGRRAPERSHRRRPGRHSQQPDALHHAGGGRTARTPHCARRRLPHPRRHRGARLPARRRPRRGASRRARAHRPHRRRGGDQPRHRAWAARCSTWCTLRATRSAATCPTSWVRDARATRSRCGPTPGWRRRCSAGAATRSLTEMCADHWRWQSTNPDGYRTA